MTIQTRLLFSESDFRNLEASLQSVDNIIGAEVIGEGNKAMAEAVAQEARSIVQVDTGRTRESIRVRRTRRTLTGFLKRQSPIYYVIAGTLDHRAALFLELGTVKMRPYPFLRPAIERTREVQFRSFSSAAKSSWQRAVGKAVGRFVGRGASFFRRNR